MVKSLGVTPSSLKDPIEAWLILQYNC